MAYAIIKERRVCFVSDVDVKLYINGKRLPSKYAQLISAIHSCTKNDDIRRRKILKLYAKHCVLLSEKNRELEFKTERDLAQFIKKATQIL